MHKPRPQLDEQAKSIPSYSCLRTANGSSTAIELIAEFVLSYFTETHSPMTSDPSRILFGQPHPSQHFLESRLRAQIVELWRNCIRTGTF